MSRNKKWKRKAKRMMGKSDLFMGECFFCDLSKYMCLYGIKCYSACNGQIRELEKKIKQENLSKH